LPQGVSKGWWVIQKAKIGVPDLEMIRRQARSTRRIFKLAGWRCLTQLADATRLVVILDKEKLIGHI
jgi:hypothetical protein